MRQIAISERFDYFLRGIQTVSDHITNQFDGCIKLKNSSSNIDRIPTLNACK